MGSRMVIVLEKQMIWVYMTKSGGNDVCLRKARVRGMPAFKILLQKKRENSDKYE